MKTKFHISRKNLLVICLGVIMLLAQWPGLVLAEGSQTLTEEEALFPAAEVFPETKQDGEAAEGSEEGSEGAFVKQNSSVTDAADVEEEIKEEKTAKNTYLFYTFVDKLRGEQAVFEQTCQDGDFIKDFELPLIPDHLFQGAVFESSGASFDFSQPVCVPEESDGEKIVILLIYGPKAEEVSGKTSELPSNNDELSPESGSGAASAHESSEIKEDRTKSSLTGEVASQANKRQNQAGPRRIVRPEQPSNTYVFYDADGKEIRRQKVVLNDTLFAPETQATSPEQGTFLGWYVGEQKLNFRADGTLLITELAHEPEDSEIHVFPKFSKMLYVTFYDEDKQTILSRQPVELAEGASSGILDISSIKAISKDPTKNFVYWQDKKGNEVKSPVRVSEDMQLYPHFGKGYWLTFNTNPTDKMNGVQIDYIAPQFVEEGKTAKEPEAPKTNSAGFSFKGWYTEKECTKAFEFSTMPINKDTIVYAKWEAKKVPFKIIVWEQNVNDDKNAKDDQKHYDVYKV